MILKHPTAAACRHIAAALESVAQDVRIDMERGLIYRDSCGTVCCHGGAYALATETAPLEWSEKRARLAEAHEMSEALYRPDYRDGRARMAEALGFVNGDKLEAWAGGFPGLWGNHNGALMFREHGAFQPGNRWQWRFEATLAGIVAHWRAVADRIDAAGCGGEPAYPPFGRGGILTKARARVMHLAP